MNAKNITLVAICLSLSGCGMGDSSSTEYSPITNINCNTNIYTEIVPARDYKEFMAGLEAIDAAVLAENENKTTGTTTVTYSVEQCNGNGNIDSGDTGDTNIRSEYK